MSMNKIVDTFLVLTRTLTNTVTSKLVNVQFTSLKADCAALVSSSTQPTPVVTTNSRRKLV
jgi:hypothetical protein